MVLRKERKVGNVKSLAERHNGRGCFSLEIVLAKNDKEVY